jgi:hypothetical protein
MNAKSGTHCLLPCVGMRSRSAPRSRGSWRLTSRVGSAVTTEDGQAAASRAASATPSARASRSLNAFALATRAPALRRNRPALHSGSPKQDREHVAPPSCVAGRAATARACRADRLGQRDARAPPASPVRPSVRDRSPRMGSGWTLRAAHNARRSPRTRGSGRKASTRATGRLRCSSLRARMRALAGRGCGYRISRAPSAPLVARRNARELTRRPGQGLRRRQAGRRGEDIRSGAAGRCDLGRARRRDSSGQQPKERNSPSGGPEARFRGGPER